MTEIGELRTERLLLRRWREADKQPFAELNADPAVMEFFPSALSRAESDAFAERIETHFSDHSFGLWAVEVTETGHFAGYIGLWPATFDSRFTPTVEVAWRLAKRFWGNGYAPEGARAALQDGFNRLGFAEIVSFTSEINLKSRRVMEKIEMVRDPAEDFFHPSVPAGDPLCLHVLYRLSAS